MHDPDNLPNTPAELDGFIQEAVARLRAQREREESFQRGPVFARLVDSLRHAPKACSFSDDDLAYHREETLERLGWSDVDEQDIDLFVSLLVNLSAATVESNSLVVDENCAFENARFRHFGLNVWVMFGQGTTWTISNDLAAQEHARNKPEAERSADPVEAALPAVMKGLLDSIASDETRAFEHLRESPRAQRALEGLRRDSLRDYDAALVSPFRVALRGLVRQVHPDDTLAQFIAENHVFVENQVRAFIRRHEGSACCSDKTRWVLNSYMRRARTGSAVVADYTQQYTFHLPRKVLCTDADVVAFLEAAQRLFYGDVEHFSAVCQTLSPPEG